MSSIHSLHQNNAQQLALIDRMLKVATEGQQAQTDQAIRFAKLAAEQRVEAVSDASKQAALDTVV